MFRAGTLSRLKRLGLFRSCRREASPKTQGLSEDASHHARKHKTPQRGRRTVSIDRFPKINGSGIPDSSPFHKKYVAHPQKSFRIAPFFKRGRRVAGREALQRAGCRAGSPARSIGQRGIRAIFQQRPFLRRDRGLPKPFPNRRWKGKKGRYADSDPGGLFHRGRYRRPLLRLRPHFSPAHRCV